MNQSQSFAFLNQTTQARKKLKRKRLEVQVKLRFVGACGLEWVDCNRRVVGLNNSIS